MPYVAHLCSSSKLGCRGAERPSAAQRRGAPERRSPSALYWIEYLYYYVRDKNVGPDLRCGAQLPADTGPFSQTALSSPPVARRYLCLCLYVYVNESVPFWIVTHVPSYIRFHSRPRPPEPASPARAKGNQRT